MHPDLVGAARDLHAIARLPRLERARDLPIAEVAAYDWLFERVATRLVAARYAALDCAERSLPCAEHEMCRLALLVFACTSLNRLAGPAFYVPRILLARLAAAAREAAQDGPADLPPDVRLWIFFIGAYCEDEGRNDGFFLGLLLPEVRVWGFGSFDEFESQLGSFLYNRELHRPTAQRVWEKSK